jgi:hypothetical protein
VPERVGHLQQDADSLPRRFDVGGAVPQELKRLERFLPARPAACALLGGPALLLRACSGRARQRADQH